MSNSFATPWTVARQAPLLMGFPRQEYWSGLPFPSPGDLPDPGIKPTSLGPPALAGGFFTIEPAGENHMYILSIYMGSLYLCVYIYLKGNHTFLAGGQPHGNNIATERRNVFALVLYTINRVSGNRPC